MAAGRLITIEGIDGAGKTTLADALEKELRARGLDVRLLREPGGVMVAERVRELVKDPALRLGGRAEARLYAAARAQLVEDEIAPLLGRGRTRGGSGRSTAASQRSACSSWRSRS